MAKSSIMTKLFGRWPFWLGTAFLLSLVLVVLGFLSVERQQEQWSEDVELVARTHAIAAELNAVLFGILECESAVRGFIITGDPEYVSRFQSIESKVFVDLSDLQALLVVPSVRERVGRLAELVKERVVLLHEALKLTRTGGLEAAAELIRSGQGKRVSDQIRAVADSVVQEQARLRIAREQAARDSARQLSFAFTSSLVVTLALLCVAATLMAWQLRRRDLEVASQRDAERRAALLAELGAACAGVSDLRLLAERVLGHLGQAVDAVVGVLYFVSDDEKSLFPAATFAVSETDVPPVVEIGQGLVGEVFRVRASRVLRDVPAEYSLSIRSALGGVVPREIAVAPFLFENSTLGVIELGTLSTFTHAHMAALESAQDRVGGWLNAVRSRRRIEEALEHTQQQAAELEVQQEELRVANEELEQQAEQLRRNEARLEKQQSELERSNLELQMASGYKSQFLANMSHELRTPLNSILILAQLLAENRHGTLGAEQVESARTIAAAGEDLLTLINEVLDLAKIESGQMTVHAEAVPLDEVAAKLEREFSAQARSKGLDLSFVLAPGTPRIIVSDRMKLEQILKNLLANALKFTQQGSVRTSCEVLPGAIAGRPALAFAVSDTGIGIPEEKREVIFDAFKQGDGSTARQYGGTGLGLSIARDLARLLGGELRLESSVGKGSTFTLVLPWRTEERGTGRPEHRLEDDRERLAFGARVVQVIEDDEEFARILLQIAREQGFKVILSPSGEQGLADAEKYRPAGIVLDLKLPGMGGMEVLEKLKANPELGGIPVHVVSGANLERSALSRGAVDFLIKPARPDELRRMLEKVRQSSRRGVRRLLVVEDDEHQRRALGELLGGEGVEVVAVSLASEAVARLRAETFDCMVLDLALPDRSGLDLLTELSVDETVSRPVVIVHTGKVLTREEEEALARYAESIIIKGPRSSERLAEETRIFLRQVEGQTPPLRRERRASTRNGECWLEGRTILLVDDDMRNVYALSKVLEEKGARVEVACQGREALELLASLPQVDLILMDIMMPVMDGFEATQAIRAHPEWARVPIIALTAKAMKGDRDRVLAVGASDYITKPIDLPRLFSVLKVWLSGLSA